MLIATPVTLAADGRVRETKIAEMPVLPGALCMIFLTLTCIPQGAEVLPAWHGRRRSAVEVTSL